MIFGHLTNYISVKNKTFRGLTEHLSVHPHNLQLRFKDKDVFLVIPSMYLTKRDTVHIKCYQTLISADQQECQKRKKKYITNIYLTRKMRCNGYKTIACFHMSISPKYKWKDLLGLILLHFLPLIMLI